MDNTLIKIVIFNLLLQGYSLYEIQKTTGLTKDQIKELLNEIDKSYKGGMNIYKIVDNATDIEKASMKAGNKLFKDLFQRVHDDCVSKGYPAGLALIYAEGFLFGVVKAFAKGHYEWGWSVINSERVIAYAQGYTLGRFDIKEFLCKLERQDINMPKIMGLSEQEYEGIKDITVDDLKTMYGISE